MSYNIAHVYSVTFTSYLKAISALYTSQDSKKQTEAQLFLQQIQNESSGWDIGLELLDSIDLHIENASYSVFVGALILQTKISKEWNVLSEPQMNHLKSRLISACLKSVAFPQFVQNKIFGTISSLAIMTVPDLWIDFVPFWFQMVDSCALELKLQRLHQVFRLLSMVLEEIPLTNLVSTSKSRLHDSFLSYAPLIMNRIEACMLEHHSLAMVESALKCSKSLIQFGLTTSDMGRLLLLLLQILPKRDTFELAIDILIDLLGNKNLAAFEETLCNKVLEAIYQPIMQTMIQQGFSEEDDPFIQALSRFCVEFGEDYTQFLVTHVSRPDVQLFFQYMLQITDYLGQFDTDTEASSISLTFWIYVQEFLEDDHSVWSPLFLSLSSILLKRIQFPEEWDKLPMDIRKGFRQYRLESSECLLSCFYLLKDQLLDHLIQRYMELCTLLSQSLNPKIQNELEAILFAILSLNEALDEQYESVTEVLFNEQVLSLMKSFQHPLLLSTFLDAIGSLSILLKTKKALLGPLLAFVSECLKVPTLKAVSAKSFRSLCTNCRSQLIDSVDWLLEGFAVIEPTLEGIEKDRFYQAVSEVLWAFRPKYLAPKMYMLTTRLLNELMNNPLKPIDCLRSLKALAQGRKVEETDSSRHASITSIELEEYYASSKENDGYLSVMDPTLKVSYADLMSRLWQVIFQLNVQAEETMNSICQLLIIVLRSEIPIFLPDIHLMCQHAVHLFNQNPGSDALVVGTTLIGNSDPSLHKEDMKNLIVTITELFISGLQSDARFTKDLTDILPKFYDFMTKGLECQSDLVFDLSPSFKEAIFFDLIKSSLCIPDRFVLKSLYQFLTTLISFDRDGNQYQGMAFAILNTILPPVLMVCIEGISTNQPPSMAVFLSDILREFLHKYPTSARSCLTDIMTMDISGLKRLNLQERQSFVNQMMTARQARQLKEVTKSLCIKCRGLENTAFARNL